MYFENYDITSVVTPVNWEKFDQILTEANYDVNKKNFLINGFRHGFRIEYEGNEKVRQKAPNLKLTCGDEVDLWNKVMNEIKLGRYAGPYKEKDIPFEHFIQSPIGLVPKDNGSDTRLIFHLSYPRKANKKLSVNANIPEEKCKVKYPDFSEAVLKCILEGKFCHISRSDMKSAFRHLGLFPGDFKFLLMKAKSPLDGEWYYMIDKCLPFGLSISCKLFQEFSDAVAFLVEVRTNRDPVNYLDDFLFAALLRSVCNEQIEVFLFVCKEINFPVNLDKTYWGTTKLTFLGFLIDTVAQVVCIPRDKVIRAINMIQSVLKKKSRKITLLQLQRICGFLNFIGRAIIPGRSFTRRLYSNINKSLKPFHHIKVNQEMRMDLEMWLTFLTHPTAVYCRPFMDFTKILTAEEINFYMDASKNVRLGFGGYCNQNWMIQNWDKDFILDKDPSIEYLELYATTAGIIAWIHNFANQRIILFTDNSSVMHMINNTSSKCRNCMVLIRLIVLKSLVHNVRIYARHVRTDLNEIADSLSRFQFRRLKKLTKNMLMKEQSTPVPETIWPISKIWMD